MPPGASTRRSRRAIRDDTAIVSVMWANNETGVLFPVEEIAAAARAKGAYFHTDAIQAVGKVPVRTRRFGDSFSFPRRAQVARAEGSRRALRATPHAVHAVPGRRQPGRTADAAGTENVASIVALGKAAELAGAHMQEESTTVRALRDRFEEGVLAQILRREVNGDRVERLPNTSSLYFPGVEGEALLVLLDKAGCAPARAARARRDRCIRRTC